MNKLKARHYIMMDIICSAIGAHEEILTPADVQSAKIKFVQAKAAFQADLFSKDRFYDFIRSTMGYYLVARDLGIPVGKDLQEALLAVECDRTEAEEIAALAALDLDPLSAILRKNLSAAAAAYDRAFTAWEQFIGGYSDEVMATLFAGSEDIEAEHEWQDRMVEAVEVDGVVEIDPWVEDKAIVMATELSDACQAVENDR